MLSPDELIGQKVWLNIPSDLNYQDSETYRVKAEIMQPTSPPWFFARYLEAPATVKNLGQWMSLYEAQVAVLQNPVIVDEDDFQGNLYEDEFDLL